jgi:DNA/RNA endonuclease YhcR with UshA esterase domain
MKTITKTFLAVMLGTGILLLAGCPDRKSIADIQADPGRYQNKDVVVAGTVKDSYGLSIPGTGIGGGAYQIDDGTGTIWVLVTEGSVPAKGAQVGVKGRVGSGVNWKGRNYGLGIYEKDRRYPRR